MQCLFLFSHSETHTHTQSAPQILNRFLAQKVFLFVGDYGSTFRLTKSSDAFWKGRKPVWRTGNPIPMYHVCEHRGPLKLAERHNTHFHNILFHSGIVSRNCVDWIANGHSPGNVQKHVYTKARVLLNFRLPSESAMNYRVSDYSEVFCTNAGTSAKEQNFRANHTNCVQFVSLTQIVDGTETDTESELTSSVCEEVHPTCPFPQSLGPQLS